MNGPRGAGTGMSARFRTGLGLAATIVCATVASAGWEATEHTIAWEEAGRTVWRFNFDPQFAKTFFHPLSAGGGASLTESQPADHRWHYGLWFSWKYINKANYWEENRETGRSEGATRWSPPRIETHADGSATISLDLTYTHPSGRVDLTEKRSLAVSAPDASGTYAIDWDSEFTAGAEGAVLGRTPMLGEPDGRVNGGYAGLGLRLRGRPAVYSVVSTEGAVERFESNRARPDAPALGLNLTDPDAFAGGIAVLSARGNMPSGSSPWYLVNSDTMHWANPAVLAPAEKQLAAGEKWRLRYRIIVRRDAWTPPDLRAALQAWKQD
jgi:hypothetical protein